MVSESAEPAPQRRRTDPPVRPRVPIGDVFGDVLPDVTNDERAPEPDGESGADAWYRDNRPPHHDRG
jgi:hypothetical protein